MDFATARKHMVDSQVRPNDVTNSALQQAMERLPRELFVPGNQQAMAYAELDIMLFPGRFLLRARDFAKLVHAAGIEQDDLVLDLGCGYGYSSAVLARISGMVMALEDSEEHAALAEAKLADLGLDNLVVLSGALTEGLPKQGPYDAIVLASGAVEHVPTVLLDQLKEGGRLVCIEMGEAPGHAVVFTKSADGIGKNTVFEASPRGIISGFAREKSFAF
ncbi:protein-L-isoaspartate O-methyltransferase [Parvularcula sp. IMCC14364]|uniref:protein-L-isoaspartate O-methyltransferase family protein n=1 Tax=Parvularcula sp. IMCC14364 TaxID=3067902 RepID=UPI0027404F61|nr:protein-L-isoaspartate O-methyltransferase [Parvularcula sp. IMCC14364]